MHKAIHFMTRCGKISEARGSFIYLLPSLIFYSSSKGYKKMTEKYKIVEDLASFFVRKNCIITTCFWSI